MDRTPMPKYFAGSACGCSRLFLPSNSFGVYRVLGRAWVAKQDLRGVLDVKDSIVQPSVAPGCTDEWSCLQVRSATD